MRLAIRIVVAVVATVLVIAMGLVAFVAWSFYQNSKPLDMAAISRLPPVQLADRTVGARISAEASALAVRAPWLTKQGSAVADSCKTGFVDSGGFSSDLPWQCTRQVLEVFGFTGSIRARSRALTADLGRGGWVAGSVYRLRPGFYEQSVAQSSGEIQNANLGAGGASLGDDGLTLLWAERPALLSVSLYQPTISPAYIDPVIRRAYARFAKVVIFSYTVVYAAGAGHQVSSAATPPPVYPAPCPSGLTNC